MAITVFYGAKFIYFPDRPPDPHQAAIRDFFHLEEGASVGDADGIRVRSCALALRAGGTRAYGLSGSQVYRCDLSFHGRRMTACFTFAGGDVKGGPLDTSATPGCERLGWSKPEHRIVTVART